MRGSWVRSLGCEDPLKKGKATHSSILAWRIPWTVQSTGSQRVRHHWATFTFIPVWVISSKKEPGIIKSSCHVVSGDFPTILPRKAVAVNREALTLFFTFSEGFLSWVIFPQLKAKEHMGMATWGRASLHPDWYQIFRINVSFRVDLVSFSGTTGSSQTKTMLVLTSSRRTGLQNLYQPRGGREKLNEHLLWGVRKRQQTAALGTFTVTLGPITGSWLPPTATHLLWFLVTELTRPRDFCPVAN